MESEVFSAVSKATNEMGYSLKQLLYKKKLL